MREGDLENKNGPTGRRREQCIGIVDGRLHVGEFPTTASPKLLRESGEGTGPTPW